MVMPADGPTPSADSQTQQSGQFASLLGKLFNADVVPVPLTGECPPADVKAPKDSPAFVKRYADAAAQSAQNATDMAACGCRQCVLGLFFVKVRTHLCTETLVAAFSGDTSKLQAFLDLIDQQKAAEQPLASTDPAQTMGL